MQEAELTYIEGTVDAVIYQNQENGYTVLRLDVIPCTYLRECSVHTPSAQ